MRIFVYLKYLNSESTILEEPVMKIKEEVFDDGSLQCDESDLGEFPILKEFPNTSVWCCIKVQFQFHA